MMGGYRKENATPVFVDGKYVPSCFQAAVQIGVSSAVVSLALCKSGGSPTLVRGRHIITARYAREHGLKEYFEKNGIEGDTN